MKTKTFIEHLKKLGYKYNIVQRNKGKKHHKLLIFDNRECGNNHPVGWIFINRSNSMRLLEGDERLFDLMYAYARTPLERREEEKKYQISIINNVVEYNSRGSYLNLRVEQDQYMFSASKETSELKTQFTQKEIDNFPDEVKELLPLCKQIEVTP